MNTFIMILLTCVTPSNLEHTKLITIDDMIHYESTTTGNLAKTACKQEFRFKSVKSAEFKQVKVRIVKPRKRR